MDENIINIMIAQDKLNMLCTDSFDIAYPIKNINSIIKADNKHQNYIIDIVLANYLARNYNSNNKEKTGLCNLIYDYADNKDFLRQMFINNVGFANELISNYYKHHFSGADINIETLDEKIKKRVLIISPIFDDIAFNFLTDLARLILAKLVDTKNNIHDDLDYDLILGTIDDAILQRIIVGDAYTYMCYNNEGGEFNNLINIIEHMCYNFAKLWDFVSNISKYEYRLCSFIIYAINLFNDDIEISEIYESLNKRNSNFLETLKIINPYYMLDYLSDINIKRYRK